MLHRCQMKYYYTNLALTTFISYTFTRLISHALSCLAIILAQSFPGASLESEARCFRFSHSRSMIRQTGQVGNRTECVLSPLRAKWCTPSAHQCGRLIEPYKALIVCQGLAAVPDRYFLCLSLWKRIDQIFLNLVRFTKNISNHVILNKI